MKRLLQNLFAGWFRLSAWFPATTMTRIHDAIAEGELGHAGEICFAVESRYSFWSVLSGLQPRDRATQLFSELRVWDTQDNSGVLLYLQLAERRVEIIADRGISKRVDDAQWQAICEQFTRDIKEGPADIAVLACVGKINELLTAHFPMGAENPRELPDHPIIL